jgi:hypothetical protein
MQRDSANEVSTAGSIEGFMVHVHQRIWLVILLLPALFSACAGLPDAVDTAGVTRTVHDARAVFDRHGGSSWDRVEMIHFTWHVSAPGHELSREWTWWPHENRVRFGGDAVYSEQEYFRTMLDEREDESTRAIDRMFVNDSYWLLYPFHVVWDDAEVSGSTFGGTEPVEHVGRITVTYPVVGGYTPGDVYDLYFDADHVVRAWNYKRGGTGEGRLFEWTEMRELGPFLFSLERRNESGVMIWFTDLEVTLTEPVETFDSNSMR